jgi:hypothetical protein
LVKWWHRFWLWASQREHAALRQKLARYKQCFEGFEGRQKYRRETSDIESDIAICDYAVRKHQWALAKRGLPKARALTDGT